MSYPFLEINGNKYDFEKSYDIEEDNRIVYNIKPGKPIKWKLEKHIEDVYYYGSEKPKIYKEKVGADINCVIFIDEDIEMELDSTVKLCFSFQSNDHSGHIDIVITDKFLVDNILFKYDKESEELIPLKYEMVVQKDDYFI